MFLCRTFDYPKIPQRLLDNLCPGEVIRNFAGRKCTKGSTEFATSSGVLYQVSDELNEWVRDNINLDIDFVGIRYQYATPEENCHGAHTDATRSYALLYTIDNAGGYLKFWQQHDNPLESPTVDLITNYDTLTEVESVDTPNNEWYLVNGRVVHSVENISSTRITLQVNLKSL